MHIGAGVAAGSLFRPSAAVGASLIKTAKDLVQRLLRMGATFSDRNVFVYALAILLRHAGFADVQVARPKEQTYVHLRRRFLVCPVNHRTYFIDISFRELFAIARPSPDYERALESVSDVFVGSEQDLQRTVEYMCEHAARSFEETGLTLPPWREARQVHKNFDFQVADRDQARIAVLMKYCSRTLAAMEEAGATEDPATAEVRIAGPSAPPQQLAAEAAMTRAEPSPRRGGEESPSCTPPTELFGTGSPATSRDWRTFSHPCLAGLRGVLLDVARLVIRCELEPADHAESPARPSPAAFSRPVFEL